MQKQQEQINQNKKVLDLVPNLLQGISLFDADVLATKHPFFRDAYVRLSNHEEFQNQAYREQWQAHLFELEEILLCFQDCSNQEIELAISVAFKVLDKNRNSVLQKKGSEVNHA